MIVVPSMQGMLGGSPFSASSLTLPEKLMGPIYFSEDTLDFYMPMETMIRRHNPLTLANTDFTPTGYACSPITVGEARIMRKSSTRLLISNRISNASLKCIEIDTTNATIASVAITNGGASNPTSSAAFFYDAVADRVFAQFNNAANSIVTVGWYKPDNSVRTKASPEFAPVTSFVNIGTSWALTQWASNTQGYMYGNALSAWQTYTLLVDGAVAPLMSVPAFKLVADSILSYLGYYWYCGRDGGGLSDFLMRVNLTGPVKNLYTIHSGSTHRGYDFGGIGGHSGRLFLKGNSGSFAVIDASAPGTPIYEEVFAGGDSTTIGQVAVDASRQLVYTGNMNTTALKVYRGAP